MGFNKSGSRDTARMRLNYTREVEGGDSIERKERIRLIMQGRLKRGGEDAKNFWLGCAGVM